MKTQRSHRSSNNRDPFGRGDKRWRKWSRHQLPPTDEHTTPRVGVISRQSFRLKSSAHSAGGDSRRTKNRHGNKELQSRRHQYPEKVVKITRQTIFSIDYVSI
ncbi:unnamed protein product [Ixodes pacificus]